MAMGKWIKTEIYQDNPPRQQRQAHNMWTLSDYCGRACVCQSISLTMNHILLQTQHCTQPSQCKHPHIIQSNHHYRHIIHTVTSSIQLLSLNIPVYIPVLSLFYPAFVGEGGVGSREKVLNRATSLLLFQ